VFPIQLPPLRERGGDVELLVAHFLAALNQAEATAKTLSPAALQRLHAHSWPGNVRELRNLVHQAFILADDEIGLEALPAELGGARPAPAGPLVQLKVGLSLDEADRCLIEATLHECGGDKKKAAQILGISLKTLYNRLKAYQAQ
jgi:DNA-binding NtrC family response regulator